MLLPTPDLPNGSYSPLVHPSSLYSTIIDSSTAALRATHTFLRNSDNVIRTRAFTSGINTSTLYTPGQILAVQLAAGIIAAISLLGALLSLYWFCMMRKKFRHKLIIILIIADLVRSGWLFIFPMVYIARGGVASNTAFCQASGFFTQTGYEMADFAVLAIAIHTAMQVFSPRPYSRSESGLYRYRWIVYPVTILLPVLLSALAFTRHGYAFLSQGPICSLPIRPFWYRLAINWIPRYVVMLTIVVLYTAIYIHVAVQFGSMQYFFGRNSSTHTTLSTLEPDRDQSVQLDFVSDSSRRHSVLVTTRLGRGSATQTPSASISHHPSISHLPTRDELAAIDPRASSSRNQSGDTTLVDGSAERFDSISHPPAAHPAVQRDREKSDFSVFEHSALANSMFPRTAQLSTDGCFDSSALRASTAFGGQQITPPRRSSTPMSALAPAAAASPSNDADIVHRRIITPAMRAKRSAIQRQLRLLFAYPLCYILTWLLPLVSNSLNYSNYYAQHPIFVLTLLAYVSVSSMGVMDCIVFGWREKPWRLIPGADGSFLGSLRPWTWQGDKIPERQGSHASTAVSDPDQTHSFARTSRLGSNLDGAFAEPQLADVGGLAGTPAARADALAAAIPGLATLDEHHDEDADGLGALRSWDFARSASIAPAADRDDVGPDGPPAPPAPPQMREKDRPRRMDWFDRRLSHAILGRRGTRGASLSGSGV